MYNFICFLISFIFITTLLNAQPYQKDSIKNNSTNAIYTFNKDSTDTDTTISNIISKDSIKTQNKKDTVYIYIKRSFNPFSFLKRDSIHSPRLLLRPFFENGISYFQNNELKNKYETKSIYYYGLGFQIGHIKTHKIIPYTILSFSKYIIDKVMYQNTKPDSIFTMKNIVVGFILPIYTFEETYIKIKFGYSISFIKESFYSINDNPWGLQIGIGVERKFIRNTRIYTDLTYIYQKSNNARFKDFDVTRLSFGIVL